MIWAENMGLGRLKYGFNAGIFGLISHEFGYGRLKSLVSMSGINLRLNWIKSFQLDLIGLK